MLMKETNLSSFSIELQDKYNRLLDILSSAKKLIIAFSGGVDSSLLTKAAWLAEGCTPLAVIGNSASLATDELNSAIDFLKDHQISYEIISVDEISNPNYYLNPTNRCFYCKSALYQKLVQLKDHLKFHTIANGTNADDLSSHRPGHQAALDAKIISPLLQANLSKVEIRELSRHLKLKTAKKPAMACLASRFPHGTSISTKRLQKVEAAESFLRNFGFYNLRVRFFEEGREARIEIDQEHFNVFFKNQEKIRSGLESLGFDKTTLNPEGFRSGSLNVDL